MEVRKTDKILVLKKDDPKNKDVGILDPGVFEGKNNLHVIMDQVTGLWSFKMEHGVVPSPLRNKYTRFNYAKEQADRYFSMKKIKIVEVKD